MSSAGGIYTAIDRIEAIGGDCVQIFTQSPRMWRPTAHTPEAIERFKTRRAEVGLGGVVCHALYLVNLAAPDDAIYGKSIAAMRATVETATAIEADAVIFHVGSHLGAGLEAGLERVVAALGQILELCDGDTWLAIENSAGTGGDDRPLDRGARDSGRRARPPSAARDVPRLVPPLRVGLRRRPTRPQSTRWSPRSTRRSGSTGSAPCTSTTARRRSGRTATGTPTSSRGRWAKGSARSSRTRRSRSSAPTSRSPAPATGPTPNELAKVRGVHARWTS